MVLAKLALIDAFESSENIRSGNDSLNFAFGIDNGEPIDLKMKSCQIEIKPAMFHKPIHHSFILRHLL